MTIEPITRSTLATIPGWFAVPDQLLFGWFLERQSRLDEHGDLVELGCYKGKSAIVIGQHLRPGETFTVVDLFGQPSDDEANTAENTASYSTLSRDEFEANYLRFHQELPSVHTAVSSTVVDLVAPGSVRFIHIDASHLYEHVATDIVSAQQLLGPDGVVVLDDFRSEHTPGVAAAAWEAVTTKGLNLIALSPTKMYATFGDPEPAQRDLHAHLTGPGAGWSEVQTICDRQVIRVNTGSLPGSPVAPPAGSNAPNPTRRLRRRVRRLEKELSDLRGSRSYRLGRALTWPVRQTRRRRS